MKAVLLGGTTGIGRAIARQLAERGESVFLMGLDDDDLARSAADLTARHPRGEKVGYARCNLEQPDGFAGPNDRWHQHFGLCVRDGVLAREAFKNPSRCAEIGGRFLSGTTMWMLHAWVVPGQSNRWGMFALANPDRQSAMPDMPDMDDTGR